MAREKIYSCLLTLFQSYLDSKEVWLCPRTKQNRSTILKLCIIYCNSIVGWVIAQELNKCTLFDEFPSLWENKTKRGLSYHRRNPEEGMSIVQLFFFRAKSSLIITQ